MRRMTGEGMWEFLLVACRYPSKCLSAQRLGYAVLILGWHLLFAVVVVAWYVTAKERRHYRNG